MKRAISQDAMRQKHRPCTSLDLYSDLHIDPKSEDQSTCPHCGKPYDQRPDHAAAVEVVRGLYRLSIDSPQRLQVVLRLLTGSSQREIAREMRVNRTVVAEVAAKLARRVN